MIKQKMTEQEFIEYCYHKAMLDLYYQMWKLVMPMAMRIMEKEMDNFIIT